MGSPKQEIWIDRNLKGLNGMVSVGVGGSFDVLSGRLKRAPVFWQRMGLEWLYRTVQEPWRIKRVSRLPIFAILVVMTRLGVDRWREEQ
jgi:N-acetylglucosaminyldiphosphoundecaprenol N-acetyl-beta-D-mannosaminyltransferase